MDRNQYQNALSAYTAAHGQFADDGGYGPWSEVSGGGSAAQRDAWQGNQSELGRVYSDWRNTLPDRGAEYDRLTNENYDAGAKRHRLMFAAATAAMGGLGALNAAGGAAGGAAEGAVGSGGTNLFASGAVPPSYYPGMEWGAGGAAASTSSPWTSALTTLLKNPQAAGTALSGLGSLLGGGGGGGNPGVASPHAMPAADMGRARQYAAPTFTPTAPPSRPGHTMGPSSAVNLGDPSASLFGYGAPPVYYKAEGGSVEGPPYETETQLLPYYGPTSTDVHRPPYDEERTTSKEPGWLDRLLSGDKKADQQLALGFGALGLLSSLLGKRQYSPGFRSVSQLQAGLPSGGGSATPNMTAYFNSPASVYMPPPPMLGAVTTPRRYAEGGAAGTGEFDSSVHSYVGGGPGGGQDDGVPARLSPGEYVFDADVVSALGDGSNEAGAQMLDRMREEIRTHKRSAPADSIPPKAKSPLEYLQGAM